MRYVAASVRCAVCALVGISPLAAQEAEDASTRGVVRIERELTFEIEIGAKPLQCEAAIALRYTQRDTIARVEGTIDNPTCAASGGDYTIAINVRGENGEVRTLAFAETWERADDQPVTFTTDYQVGANVDLLSVRSRRLTCMCAEAPAN